MAQWKSKPGETPIDPSGLLDKSIRTRKQLNAAEAKNIASAVYKYLLGGLTPELAPFDLAWLLGLHGEMFGQVWSWAGSPRKIDLNLGCPWPQIETRLYDLLQTIPFWADMSLMEQAARLHHRSVSIHPFENGNGRWARMLANLWLKLKGSQPTIWPEKAVGETSLIRDEYLAAVQSADSIDYAPLIALHERYTPRD